MKKWIHANSFEYTDMIDEIEPLEVSDLIVTDCNDITYSQLKSAFDAFGQDYKKFPPASSVRSLDIDYDKDKGRFYRKYRPFADKCKEIVDNVHLSEYGIKDYEKAKIVDLAKKVEYNFPYGWKSMQ